MFKLRQYCIYFLKEIIQITITLLHSSPLIKRRLFVFEDTSFFELHHIIQIAMGWKNYHLFEFSVDGYRIGIVDESEFGFNNNHVLAAKTVTLFDIITSEEDSFQYRYDFGDCWIHEISIEKWGEVEDNGVYPLCVDGQLNCPPEDCGGIEGYYGLLKVLQDKTHPEYDRMSHWVGPNFDPEKFDKARVKRQLKTLQKYISRWNAVN